ncbi:hypothetical protein TNCV_1950441 [Trichonephila clavipes]|nr:hypothetical protein TNCV_1950441 [Trichonephila clavipes]
MLHLLRQIPYICENISLDLAFKIIQNPFLLHGHSPGLRRLSHDRKDKGLVQTATASSDVVQSGRPIFDDFFQHLWPSIGNNTANVVFQMVKRLWLIRIDQ